MATHNVSEGGSNLEIPRFNFASVKCIENSAIFGTYATAYEAAQNNFTHKATLYSNFILLSLTKARVVYIDKL